MERASCPGEPYRHNASPRRDSPRKYERLRSFTHPPLLYGFDYLLTQIFGVRFHAPMMVHGPVTAQLALEAAAKALRGPAGGRRPGDRAGCGALPASALYGEDSRHGAHRVRRSRLDHGGPPDGVGRLGGGAAAQARGVGSSGRAILAGSPSLLAERRMDYLLGHSPIRIIPRFTKCRSSGAKSRRPKKPETSSSRKSKSPTSKASAKTEVTARAAGTA